ncbi:hypothetical protein QUB70_23785, partial [Microcoleus sp. A003_D6]|uniref:hypothetical protein n=1 Tax=Microcoleus sp. A003_D6 TaxID=3055266 RepID=UPI002FD56611
WQLAMISSAIDRNISAVGASLPDIRFAPKMICKRHTLQTSYAIFDWQLAMISSAIDRNISAVGASLPDIRVAPKMICKRHTLQHLMTNDY